MSTSIAVVLLSVGALLIIGLGIYAFKLHKEVKRREALVEDEKRRAVSNSLENLDYVVGALVQEQVDITEGCWRCKVLLEIIDTRLTERPDFQAFAEVYQRTRHLKTHSARNQLTLKARHQEDKERLAVEDDMRDKVLAAANAVILWRQEGKQPFHKDAS